MSWGKVDGVLSYKGFDFACEFKRVKYLRLKLSHQGKFKLSVPFNYTQKAVVAFLDKNEAWINKKFTEFQQNSRKNDGKVEFLGKKYELKFDESVARVRILKAEFFGKNGENEGFESKGFKNEGFENERGENLMNLAGENGIILAKNEADFEAFLKANARKIYAFYVKKWQGHFEKPVVRLSVKKMTTRWGSCNSKKGFINLNLRLITKPLKAIEYVILHELTHLKFAHHQASFYDEISRLMPDFKEREKMLKG